MGLDGRGKPESRFYGSGVAITATTERVKQLQQYNRCKVRYTGANGERLPIKLNRRPDAPCSCPVTSRSLLNEFTVCDHRAGAFVALSRDCSNASTRSVIRVSSGLISLAKLATT